MRWWLFFHLLAAMLGVGFIFFQILLAAHVKRMQGTPDEAPLMKGHLLVARKGMVMLIALVVTGVAMWMINDYKVMGGSTGWLHAKLSIALVLFGMLFIVSIPNGKKVGMGLAASQGVVTDEIRTAYRKAVMAAHTGMFLVLVNVILGYWKPGY